VLNVLHDVVFLVLKVKKRLKPSIHVALNGKPITELRNFLT